MGDRDQRVRREARHRICGLDDSSRIVYRDDNGDNFVIYSATEGEDERARISTVLPIGKQSTITKYHHRPIPRRRCYHYYRGGVTIEAWHDGLMLCCPESSRSIDARNIDEKQSSPSRNA